MTEPCNDDRSQARSEAAALLGVDIDHLSPADGLRVDMVSALRLVIDHEQASVLSGSSADLGKLNVAVQSLIALLPGRELPAPAEQHHQDPRQVMWEIYKQMRERGEIDLKADEGLLQAEIDAQAAEIERLKAQLAGGLAPVPSDAPMLVESVPAPAGGNVVPLPRPNPPAASAAPQYDYNKDRGWRDYVEADATIRSTPRGRGHYWGPV
jgi:hypothetical protein